MKPDSKDKFVKLIHKPVRLELKDWENIIYISNNAGFVGKSKESRLPAAVIIRSCIKYCLSRPEIMEIICKKQEP